MPIYEYRCQACGHPLEEMQKISEPPLTVCPACGKPKLERLISHTSFQLKGGGYYATDYKDKNKPQDKKAEDTEKKPPADSASTTTEATTKKDSTPSSDDKA